MRCDSRRGQVLAPVVAFVGCCVLRCKGRYIYTAYAALCWYTRYRLCGAYTRGGLSRETFLGPRLDDFVVIGPLLWVPYPWIKSCGRRRLHSFAHQPIDDDGITTEEADGEAIYSRYNKRHHSSVPSSSMGRFMRTTNRERRQHTNCLDRAVPQSPFENHVSPSILYPVPGCYHKNGFLVPSQSRETHSFF